MGNPTGFLTHDRIEPKKRPIKNRILDHKEIYIPMDDDLVNCQSSRCMDCGVPFCHEGCPLGNVIPEFNDAVFEKDWDSAYEILSATNNFPEFTGRICPAPCEAACVLGINQAPVTIEHIEKEIIERAFASNRVKIRVPKKRGNFKIAIVGSGPAGLAAADELNQMGHSVTVFERNDRIGGLLRYGIPDFKLSKSVIDRRINILEAEGINFECNTNIGQNYSVEKLQKEFDSILLCIGSTVPRDLPLPGRKLSGIHFAMDYLHQHNKRVAGDSIPKNEEIIATGKHVVVLGGGDTGADCVGTAIRQGAKSVKQLELLGKPPQSRSDSSPWPNWPVILRTSTSHEEGCDRQWAVNTKAFIGNQKNELTNLELVRIKWEQPFGADRAQMLELQNSTELMKADLVLLALGYTKPQNNGLFKLLGVTATERGLISSEGYQTENPTVFACGDARRGQSLVVWAIAEGREAAQKVNEFLHQKS